MNEIQFQEIEDRQVTNNSMKSHSALKTAFVTCDNLPELTEDDKFLAEYLLQKNISAKPVSWDDASVDWKQFDLIVLRSMWDYFEKPVEFDKWLDKMEELGCNVLNPVSVVRWNQNKSYFDDFVKAGVLLPPYVICRKNESESLKGIMNDNGWTKAVVKPAISGGAFNTWVTTNQTVDSDEFEFVELLKAGDVIVQKFVEEILTNGEISLVFFNKKFSHAFCKRVKQGDFRVQSQFGGTEEIIHPDQSLIDYSTKILTDIEEPLLYARVDGVLTDDNKFLLMELELIEPSLSVSRHDEACKNFHEALCDLLK